MGDGEGGETPKGDVRRWGRDHTLARGDQACAYPEAILKNFTNQEFEFYVLKILTDFFNFGRFLNQLLMVMMSSM